MSASKLAVLLCAVMACPHAAIAQAVWAPPAAGAWAAGEDVAADTAVVRATLENPMPHTFGFGYSVAIDGDTLVVGAPLYATNGIQRGGAAIYTRTGGRWVLQQTLTRDLDLSLGGSVAISADTVVVAPYGRQSASGYTYVFIRNNGRWTLQAQLLPRAYAAQGPGERVAKVAIDGDTALVAYHTGAVYAFTRAGSGWTEQARLKPEYPSDGQQHFLGDIDLDGDTALIGAPGETVGANSRQGAVHVFVNNGNVWTRQATLTASTGRADSYFGQVLALSGDTAIVGPRQGYVFTRGGGTWVEQASLELPPDPYGPSSVTLKLDNVTLDGDTAIVSSSAGRSSASNVYRRSGGRWTRLEPAFTTWPTMAISGNTMLVGEPGFGGNDNDPFSPDPGPGIAYVLEVPDGGGPQAPALTGSVSGTTVTLNWTPSAAATSYVIEAGTASGLSNVFNGNVGNVLQVAATPVPGTYYVRIRGVNASGAGAASNEVVLSVGQSSNRVPGAPTLTGSVSDTTATLAWTPSAGGGVSTSYFLEAGTASGMSNVFSGNVGGGTQLVATVPAGTYYVRLRGVNAAGIGVASNEIVLTVGGCTPPSTPTGLTFTRSGDVVTVLWNAAPGAVEYFLEAGTSPGARNVYNGTVGSTTSVSSRVNPGTYYVRVLGANSCGVSGASSELSIAVP